MVSQQAVAIHARLQNDLQFFAEHCLQIATKAGPLRSFTFNKAQIHIDKTLNEQLVDQGVVRALLLKGRQQGCSTYVGGKYLHKSVTQKNINTFILSHDSQTTDKLFDMVDRFHTHLPPGIKPKCATKNRRKLIFEGLGSTYSVGTAGNAEVGRGGTLQLFHGSEVGFWQNTDNLDTGLLQSVADIPGTEIILESTANGAAGYYYEKYMSAIDGKGDYIPVFVPWFWQDEYVKQPPADFALTEEEIYLKILHKLNDAQVYWRRKKIEDFRGQEWKFKQEYPFDAMEAFQTSGERFFRAESVLTAMSNEPLEERGAPLIVGVDPAGGGKDSVSISWRRGRSWYKNLSIPGEAKAQKDQMVIVGRIARIIENDDPDMVFIDMGYGDGIISRLRELGYGRRITGVYFSEHASDTDRYSNKRAEMHDLGREWLLEPNVSIPNDRRIQKQLMAVPQERVNSNGKMLIPSKEEVKKNNNNESPGELDSWLLTFAYPVRPKAMGQKTIQKVGDGTVNAKKAQSPLLTLRRNSNHNSGGVRQINRGI